MDAGNTCLRERVAGILPALVRLRENRRRGFVIELAGMPNAGKSELMGNLRHLFYVAAASVYAKVEGAFNLPILPDERQDLVAYNLRTLNYAQTQLLRHDLRLFDVLLFERSLFDAYCWFTLLNHQRKLDDATYGVIKEFLLLEKYRERLDLVIDFIGDPQVLLDREITARYTSQRSVGTNINMLQALYEIHARAADELRDQFRILQVDTSTLSREAVYEWVAERTLGAMEASSALRND